MGGMIQMPVLIVEGDRASRNVYRFLLEIAGYQVVEAADALSAVEVLRTFPSGMVVLLNWEMPEAGCMRILRGLVHTPEVAARHRFVMLARAPESLHSRLLALPASLSITPLRKPTKKADLLAAIALAARAVSRVSSGALPAR